MYVNRQYIPLLHICTIQLLLLLVLFSNTVFQTYVGTETLPRSYRYEILAIAEVILHDVEVVGSISGGMVLGCSMDGFCSPTAPEAMVADARPVAVPCFLSSLGDE